MSTNHQRVLNVQDASRELCIDSMRHIVNGLSLRCGTKIMLLVIIQAFTKSNSCYLKGCGFLPNKTKLHSSATINKHKKDVEEETQQTRERYLNSAEFMEMLRLAETFQVELDLQVEAGLLKEVALEYAKSFQATHVILNRKLGKELKYFTQNLSCGISRIKPDNSIEIVRPTLFDEVGEVEEAIPYLESWEQWREIDFTCSFCTNRRPWLVPRKKFSFAELQIATNGFSQQNLMSDHGRRIYLGLLNDQRKILIRESPSVTIKEENFQREVQILEGIRHENVTLLIGSCSEGPHRFLVYEYICNGSLNNHLSNNSRELTWERRVCIAYGAAKGLEYLHEERIYGSMRPSNILINHDYQPSVSYYGLTNQYEALRQSSDTRVLTTFEYLAPEYMESGIDMSKADVYSFGVVLLELITGRKTIEDTDGQSFSRWARPLLRGKKYEELLDPIVKESADLHHLFWLVHVAENCLSWKPKSRYSIQRVVKILSDIINGCVVEDFSPQSEFDS